VTERLGGFLNRRRETRLFKSKAQGAKICCDVVQKVTGVILQILHLFGIPERLRTVGFVAHDGRFRNQSLHS